LDFLKPKNGDHEANFKILKQKQLYKVVGNKELGFSEDGKLRF